MRADFLPGFLEPSACDALMARADEILRASPPSTVSIFTTNEQARHSDTYFLESGDKIRCFYEEDAWDDRGDNWLQGAAMRGLTGQGSRQ